MNILKVKNLWKTYRRPKKEKGFKGTLKGFFKREVERVPALKGISFSLKKGEILGFVGPNGAGKTTTMKILSGILYPTKGEVNVLGFVPFKREKKFLKKTSFVMGEEGFLEEIAWDLSSRDGLYFIKNLYEMDEKKFKRNFNEMTEILEVKDFLDVPLRRLSKGQKMRIELIASLIFEPEVLFLDEPTLGLDIISQKKIRDFIREYVYRKEASCILTSHYMRDVEELSTRLIIIDKGEFVYEGSVAGAIQKFSNKKVIEFTTKDEKDILEDLQKFDCGIEGKNGVYRILTEKERVAEITQKILGNFNVQDITVEEPDLEEVLRGVFETYAS